MADESNQDQVPEKSSHADDAQELNLDEQVDNLLDDVETMTNEILSEPTQSKQLSPSTPARPVAKDPAKQVIADDMGMSEQSPLVQDGEKTPVGEVVADVDKELDHMEELISEMSPPEESLESAEDNAAQESMASAPAEETDTSLDDDIASQIASEPDAEPVAFSDKERKLDADLDELLARQATSDDSMQLDEIDIPQIEDTSVEPPAEPTEPVQATQVTADEVPVEAYESLSIWKLIQTKVRCKVNHLKEWLNGSAGNVLVRLLDKLDGPFGRLSPMTKEIIGFCALGTLAMSVVTIIIVIIF